MFSSLQARLKRASRLLPVALLPFAAHAQFNYVPANAVNTTTAYTDLGTTGTAIATANTDDANSAAADIGFTFNYNGSNFTQFVLNTNGFIKLGATAPSAANLYYGTEVTINGDPFSSTSPADVNILAPFNVDLLSGTAGPAEYRVSTTGVAGSQVCTIQWKNVSDKTLTNSPQYDNFSFQVKLYEGTNNIEFVYGPTVAGTTGADAFRIAASGIKGSGSTAGQTVMVNKTSSAAPWSSAVFITGAYSGSAFNYRRTSPADAGRTFRFVAVVLPANDAAVKSVFTLGTASSSYGSPVTVDAVIANTGSSAQTNLPVTLTVTGATPYTATQTIPSLAVGTSTTVTFALPLSASTGTNTLTVTIPTDAVNTNNSASTTQTVSAATESHFTAGTTTYDGGYGSTTANIALLARFKANAGSALQTVTPTFLGTTSSTYQIVVYGANATTGAPSTLLYTSPTLTRPAKDGAVATAIPGLPVAGDFFVGVKQLTTTNIGLAAVITNPLRPATFYLNSGTVFQDLATAASPVRLALDVTLGTATATRNAELANAITVSPNPANQRFTVAVPAGSLRTASATLANALGQTVQTRQLSLPAAGGTADFDVSNLAPGVYTLALKSGNDLVVKRVVVE